MRPAFCLLFLGACTRAPAPSAEAPRDAGVAQVVASASATPTDPPSVVPSPTPLVPGHRVVWSGKGDPAARGCELRETGSLECSDAGFHTKKYPVPPAVARTAIERIVTREETCMPREARRPPGSYPTGSLGDGTRSVNLCDADTTLGELRALEATYSKKN